MGAEDFSFFLQQRPGCFFFVGCALPGDIRPHHKSVFDFDERGVLVSASVFVQIIRDILRWAEVCSAAGCQAIVMVMGIQSPCFPKK
jgi:hypothetical protein